MQPLDLQTKDGMSCFASQARKKCAGVITSQHTVVLNIPLSFDLHRRGCDQNGRPDL